TTRAGRPVTTAEFTGTTRRRATIARAGWRFSGSGARRVISCRTSTAPPRAIRTASRSTVWAIGSAPQTWPRSSAIPTPDIPIARRPDASVADRAPHRADHRRFPAVVVPTVGEPAGVRAAAVTDGRGTAPGRPPIRRRRTDPGSRRAADRERVYRLPPGNRPP